MLLRAIDGRFIRSSVLFPFQRNGDDNERLPPASKFFTPSGFLICTYIERDREREKDITNIEVTSIAPAEVANQLRCRTPRRSLSGLGALSLSVSCPRAFCVPALSRRFLCLAPALSVSGPSALCVGPRRSLCRGPVLSVSAVSGPSALCVGPHAPIRMPPIRPRGPPAPIGLPPIRSAGPQLFHLVRGPPPQIRVPPIQPGAIPFSRREPETLLFGGKI